jgi:transcriptional regulator with XRE-family HTH domain
MKDLGRFMTRIGATLEDVANATGLSPSTISRIRSGEIASPRLRNWRKIQAWATSEAKRLGLKPSERLEVGE